MKHRAPVIAIQILDGLGHPLPEPYEVENKKAKAADLNGNHRVIICSEEQFKVSIFKIYIAVCLTFNTTCVIFYCKFLCVYNTFKI